MISYSYYKDILTVHNTLDAQLIPVLFNPQIETVFEFYEFDVNLPINSVLGLKNMIMFFLDEPVPPLRAFINSLLK